MATGDHSTIRTGERIIGRLRIDRLGFGHGVDRDADKFCRTQQRARGSGVAAGRQMHAVGAGEFGKRRLAVQHEPRVVTVRDRQQAAKQRHLLILRQIFFAQADPAAAAGQRRGDKLGQRTPRLRAVVVTGLTDVARFLGELARRPLPGSWETLHLQGMVGDEDDHCLQPGLFLKRTISRSGLAVFPKTGHTLNLEEPELFNRHVAEFIAQVEAGRWAPRDPRADPAQVMRTD